MKDFPDGVWPTMITPFTDNGGLDLAAIPPLVDWYIARGVSGLFAVCQSSEMVYLSLEEKRKLAAAVVSAAHGRVPVVASGHTSDAFDDQVAELTAAAGTGAEAVVLVTNRMAAEHEGDATWISNAKRLLDALPSSTRFGLYECPHPYKRLLTLPVLEWCIESGRFAFLKDTSCDAEVIRSRIDAMRGSGFKLYNANAATLLRTLRDGGAGYSGVMANFHPEHYAWLCREWAVDPVRADRMQAYLGVTSAIESRSYPQNAKVYLSRAGVPMGIYTRAGGAGLKFEERFINELDQFRDLNAGILPLLTGTRSGAAAR